MEEKKFSEMTTKEASEFGFNYAQFLAICARNGRVSCGDSLEETLEMCTESAFVLTMMLVEKHPTSVSDAILMVTKKMCEKSVPILYREKYKPIVAEENKMEFQMLMDEYLELYSKGA